MNRNEIITAMSQFANEMGVSVDTLVLGYGAALVMHGLRESTNDLDLDVPSEMWHETAKKIAPVEGLLGPRLIWSEHIDLHLPKVDQERTVVIDGIRCYSLEELLDCYKVFLSHPDRKPESRDKDRMAIGAILNALYSSYY